MIASLKTRWQGFCVRFGVWCEIKRVSRRWNRWKRGKMTADEVVKGYDVETKKSCRICHGRGFTGWDPKTGDPVLCKCARAVKRL